MESLEIMVRQPIENISDDDELARLPPPARDAMKEIGYYNMPDRKAVMLTTNDFHKLLACVFMATRAVRV